MAGDKLKNILKLFENLLPFKEKLHVRIPVFYPSWPVCVIFEESCTVGRTM